MNPEAPLAKQFAIEMKSSTGAGDLVFSMTKNRVRRVAMRQVMVVHCTPKLSESAPVKVDAVDQRLEMATTVEWLAEGRAFEGFVYVIRSSAA
mgnify:CR=1 FL=1